MNIYPHIHRKLNDLSSKLCNFSKQLINCDYKNIKFIIVHKTFNKYVYYKTLYI